MIRNQFKGTMMIAYKTRYEKEKKSEAGRPERKVQSVAKTSHSPRDYTFLHAVIVTIRTKIKFSKIVELEFRLSRAAAEATEKQSSNRL